MKFDYVLANPPYSLGENRVLWSQIMNKVITLSDKIMFIAPFSGITGRNNWKKHKDIITTIKQVPRDVFPVKVNIGICYLDKTLETDEIIYEHLINEKMVKETLNKKEFSQRIPRVQMLKEEYQETFSQDGQRWLPRVCGVAGVWRPTGQTFEYTGNMPETKHMNRTDCGYLPCSKEVGEVLAVRLQNLLEEGKIEGQWGFLGAKYWTVDLDPIRRDLL